MQTDQDIEAIWNKLASIYSNKRGLRPQRSWFNTGMSARTTANRLRLLEGGPAAKLFFEHTKNCDRAALQYLRVRAKVNQEQAATAARINTVMNVTILIGFVVLTNQLFPGLIQRHFSQLLAEQSVPNVIIGVILPVFIVCLAGFIAGYSYAGVTQARDLVHMLELSLARRGLEPADDGGGDGATVEDGLRRNFLSDV